VPLKAFFILERGVKVLKVGFIGAGKVGNALAIKLNARSYNVAAVASRTFASAEKLAQMVTGCQSFGTLQAAVDAADLVFITTPDGVIGQVASQLKWRPGQCVVHCSGADSTLVLEPAKQMGAQTGAFHPLQTFAGIKQAVDNLPGSTFAIEAEEPLSSTLKQMAEDLGGYWIELKAGDKVLYHASAVIACNYLITLTKLATDLWQSFGIPRKDAVRALMPLLKGTLNNLENIGIPDCLTGPIARGDTGTVQKHLAALDTAAPFVAETYRELGLKTIPISLSKGKIDESQAEELRALLEKPAPVQAGITSNEE
jgi:predicted short-subunit dehydrogenase-like oxidoreductase (DUF2520 family)